MELVRLFAILKIALASSGRTPDMEAQLNAMEAYFDNLRGFNGLPSKFDTYSYERIEECFSKFDDNLLT